MRFGVLPHMAPGVGAQYRSLGGSPIGRLGWGCHPVNDPITQRQSSARSKGCPGCGKNVPKTYRVSIQIQEYKPGSGNYAKGRSAIRGYAYCTTCATDLYDRLLSEMEGGD